MNIDDMKQTLDLHRLQTPRAWFAVDPNALEALIESHLEHRALKAEHEECETRLQDNADELVVAKAKLAALAALVKEALSISSLKRRMREVLDE